MSPRSYQDLKEQVWLSNLEIPRRGLAIYTFGNVSGLDAAAGVFAIKPSGVPYETLKAEDMVIVDLEGRVVEGKLRPSSDTPTHAVLYRRLKGLGGIVHTHSTWACAWAQAQRSIPVYGTTHADHLAFPVPCTAVMSDRAIQGDYEIETGNQIVETFRTLDPHQVPMVLVACHGPFTWGTTPEKAVYHAAVLEELARMALLTEQANPRVKPLKASLIRKHFDRKHGPGAYYGQPGNAKA